MTYQWQIAPGYTMLRSGVTMTVHMCRALDTNGDLVVAPGVGNVGVEGMTGLYGFLIKVDGLLGLTGTATLTSGTPPTITVNAEIGGNPAAAASPSGTAYSMGLRNATLLYMYAPSTGGPGTGGGWIEPNQWYFNEEPILLKHAAAPYPEEVWVDYDPWVDYPTAATPPPTFP